MKSFINQREKIICLPPTIFIAFCQLIITELFNYLLLIYCLFENFQKIQNQLRHGSNTQ